MLVPPSTPQGVLAVTASRECLDTFLIISAFVGSFDSVDAALRATSTALRMTQFCT